MSPFSSSPRRFLRQTASALALLLGSGMTSAFAVTPDKPGEAPQQAPTAAFAQQASGLADLLGQEKLSGDQIRALQIRLTQEAGATFTPTGTIGPLTLSAIEKAVTAKPELAGKLGPAVLAAFAEKDQLEDLGRALAATPAARDAFAKTVLADVAKAKAAHTGAGALPYRDDVKVLQAALDKHSPGPKDGRYGSLTDGGVQRYLGETAPVPVVASPATAPTKTGPDVNVLTPATLDVAGVRAIQTMIGVESTGHFGPVTAGKLRDFLQDHPEAYGALGQGAVKALKERGELPKVIANLGRLLKDNPGRIADLGQSLIENKGSPYVLRMAIKAAGGAGDVKDMNKPLTVEQVARLQQSLTAKAATTKSAAVVAPTTDPVNPALLSAVTLDRATLKDLQRAIGTRMPTGVFDQATAEKMRGYLQKNPDAYAVLGKGIVEGLKKTNLLPNVAADMARMFQKDPDQIRRTGEAAIRNGSPAYLTRMALKLARGDMSVKDMDAPLTTEELTRTFESVLFRTKGITQENPQPAPDGTYAPQELGISLLNFTPTNPKRLVEALKAQGRDLEVPQKAPKGTLERKLGVALATTLANDPRLMEFLAKSGTPGVAVFGFLMGDPKRAAEAGAILRQSEVAKTALVTDLLRYAGAASQTLSTTPKGRNPVLSAPDRENLALRLGLVLATEDAGKGKGKDRKADPAIYRPDPAGNGFSAAFATAAARYLRSGHGPNAAPVRELRDRAAAFFAVAAKHLKPVESGTDPAAPVAKAARSAPVAGGAVDVARLKRLYPHDTAGLVDITVEIAPQYGVRPEVLLAIMDVESGLRLDARPYRKDGTLASSAHGPTQALDRTWKGWWNRFKHAIGVEDEPKTDQDVLALRTDPRVAVTMLANAVKASGHTDALSYYFTHHFGTFGQVLLNSPPEALVTGILPTKDTEANEYLRDKTVEDLVTLYTGHFQRRGALGPVYLDGRGPKGPGAAVVVQATPAPVSRIADQAFLMPRDRGVFRAPVLTEAQIALAFRPPEPVVAVSPVAKPPVIKPPVQVAVAAPEPPAVVVPSAVAPVVVPAFETVVVREPLPVAAYFQKAAYHPQAWLPGVSAVFRLCAPFEKAEPAQPSHPPVPTEEKRQSVVMAVRSPPPAKPAVACYTL